MTDEAKQGSRCPKCGDRPYQIAPSESLLKEAWDWWDAELPHRERMEYRTTPEALAAFASWKLAYQPPAQTSHPTAANAEGEEEERREFEKWFVNEVSDEDSEYSIQFWQAWLARSRKDVTK